MNSDDVQAWLDNYVEAWRSYDRDQIEALFSRDARYQYRPWEEALIGAGAIADNWLSSQDEPGSWEASYQPLVVDGNKAITSGKTTYANGRLFWNLWEVDFDDAGRCSRFVEWYMLEHK